MCRIVVDRISRAKRQHMTCLIILNDALNAVYLERLPICTTCFYATIAPKLLRPLRVVTDFGIIAPTQIVQFERRYAKRFSEQFPYGCFSRSKRANQSEVGVEHEASFS